MSQASDNEHGSWLQEVDEGLINSVGIQEAIDSIHSSTSETYVNSGHDNMCPDDRMVSIECLFIADSQTLTLI